jgi:predicted ATPase
MITTVSVDNFKTFRNLTVDLRAFNLVIGANASGKSNFVSIFRFLSNALRDGLENAVSMEGGAKHVRNLSSGPNDTVDIGISVDGIHRYELSIAFEGDRPVVSREFLTTEIADPLGTLSAIRTNNHVDFDSTRYGSQPSDTLLTLMKMEPRSSDELILAWGYPGSFFGELRSAIDNISVYDVEPSGSKASATPLAGKIELDKDGSNIALVLNRLLKDDDSRRMLMNLVKDVFPFVTGIGTEELADRWIFFKIVETWSKDHVPASLLSNGTVALITLIVAIYFEKNSLAIVEEPERHLHPALMSKLIDMLRDASRTRQLIVTTHSPELVRHAVSDELLLLSREADGASSVSRPLDDVQVKAYLDAEIGLGELFVQNLLSA